jgi:hypothetical protein
MAESTAFGFGRVAPGVRIEGDQGELLGQQYSRTVDGRFAVIDLETRDPTSPDMSRTGCSP